MVDKVSRTNETSRDVREAKPTVIVNNVGGGNKGKSDSTGGLPIGMGSARNQENAFARYLTSTFAPM
jgi:hypothetical protein